MSVQRVLEVYEDACLAYARNRKTDDPLGCDRGAMVAAFLTIKAALEPNITFLLYEEGGEWKPFGKQFRPGPIVAFKCSDGRIWDIHNGWRV
jgi:hypothetical protein